MPSTNSGRIISHSGMPGLCRGELGDQHSDDNGNADQRLR